MRQLVNYLKVKFVRFAHHVRIAQAVILYVERLTLINVIVNEGQGKVVDKTKRQLSITRPRKP